MGKDVVFVPNPIAWEHEFRSWQGMVGRHMYDQTIKVNARASLNAPGPGKPPRNRTRWNYSTGRLQRSIHPQRASWNGEVEGRVIALPKYAGYVHGGTKPHFIVAKKRFLFFYWKKRGIFVHAFKVRHPGMQAYPFMYNALVSQIETLR